MDSDKIKHLIQETFGPVERTSITARDSAFAGWCVSVAGLAGRDFVDKYISDVSSTGGVLSIKVDPPEYDTLIKPDGRRIRKLKAFSKYTLFYFERCDFENSLNLLDALNFPRGSESKAAPIENVKEFLRCVKTRHNIVLDEFGRGYVEVRQIGAKSPGWKDEVVSALAFNRSIRGLPDDKFEDAGYLDQFTTHRFLVIWYGGGHTAGKEDRRRKEGNEIN